MIKNRVSLSMAEAEEYLQGNESSAELSKFIKKFSRLDIKKSKELRAKLEEMNSMKIRSENISKIIDVLPETSEDLNKIFVDGGLDESESQQILSIVKGFIK
jgi:DNA-directed RNA polymerase subunit F